MEHWLNFQTNEFGLNGCDNFFSHFPNEFFGFCICFCSHSHMFYCDILNNLSYYRVMTERIC